MSEQLSINTTSFPGHEQTVNYVVITLPNGQSFQVTARDGALRVDALTPDAPLVLRPRRQHAVLIIQEARS